MAATIKPSEALKRDPEFFNKRAPGLNWVLEVYTNDGIQKFEGVDWVCRCRFGEVGNVVCCDKDGNPVFDRPFYSEAPAINAVAWGRDPKSGEIKLAVVKEERPHADGPESPYSTDAVRFAQVPMGFMEKLFGKDETKRWEDAEVASVREIGEETGRTIIKNISRPSYPWHNASPSFVKSSVDLVFVEVDLSMLEELRSQRGELIYKAEFVSAKELVEKIKKGRDPDGAFYRGATSNSLWMIFFACFPEFWPK